MHQGSKYVLGLNMSGAKKYPGQNKLLSRTRQSGYSFVLTCYSWSLALCLGWQEMIAADLISISVKHVRSDNLKSFGHQGSLTSE